MADVIGRAIIEVAPDVTRFARQVTRDLNKAFRGFKKISVGVSVGSLRKAFVEVSKLNLALRATIVGFTLLGGKVVVAGLLSAASAAAELSGALLVIPAAGAAAGIAMATLAIGLHGLDDVFKALVDRDMKKFNEALAEMSPEAQKSIRALRQFMPAIESFRDAIQDTLLGGLAPTIQRVFLTILPIAERGFVGMAKQINLAAREFANFATSAQSLVDLQRIFENTNRAARLFRPSVTLLGQALRDIVVVGSEFLPLIAGELTIGAARLRDFIAQARDSGALVNFIAEGISRVHQLIETIINLSKAIGGVLKIADSVGFGILDIINRLAETFNNFVQSIEGQAAFRNFFISAHQAAAALGPVLREIFFLLTNQVAPILAQFATIVGPAVTIFIRAIGQALEAARPGIEAFATGFAKFLESVAPALPAIGELAGAIGGLLGSVLERVGPVLADFIELLSEELIKILEDPDFVEGVMDFVDALGEFFIALIPLIRPLGDLAKVLLPLFADIIRILIPIIEPLVDLLDAFVDVLEPLAPVIKIIVTAIALFVVGLAKMLELILRIVEAILNIPDTFFEVFDAAFGTNTQGRAFEGSTAIAEAVDRINGKFAEAGAAAQIFGEATTGWFTEVAGSAETQFGRVGAALQSLHEPLGAAGSAVVGFSTGTATSFNAAGNAVEAEMRRIGEILFGAVEPLGQAGSAIGTAYVESFRSSINPAVAAAQDVANSVAGILGNTSRFGAAGSALGKAFAGGIEGSINAAVTAAQKLAASVARIMPGSPAKEGPFSGRGWTPFRGRALVEGFAEGITSGLQTVRFASLNVAAASVSGLTATAPILPSGVGITATAGQARSTSVNTQVRVFIDGQELRGVVVDVLDEHDRNIERFVQSGVGGA